MHALLFLLPYYNRKLPIALLIDIIKNCNQGDCNPNNRSFVIAKDNEGISFQDRLLLIRIISYSSGRG